MSDGMGREPAYLSSHATNRYFIPNWGMIKPTDCSLSVFNASSLLENRFRSLEKDTSLSRNTKKERIVFPFGKKAYLCSWTITS